jgi:single-strand DNA-binding protein
MARSVNKAILVGHVGKEVEFKNTNGGTPVANFSLATSEQYQDKNSGNKVENTDWHNMVAFSRQAEIVRDYVKKGMLLYIEGRIKTRSWDDKDSGKKVYRTEIIIDRLTMLSDGKGAGEGRTNGNDQQANSNGNGYNQSAKGDAYEPAAYITSDDIPSRTW